MTGCQDMGYGDNKVYNIASRVVGELEIGLSEERHMFIFLNKCKMSLVLLPNNSVTKQSPMLTPRVPPPLQNAAGR